jgi:hypothetical protein
MNDTPENSDVQNEPVEQPDQLAVVFIGALDDCKETLAFLTGHDVPAMLHVAELVRPDLRARGYYLVATALDEGERARALIEAHFHRTFNITTATPAADEPERCPACAALLPGGCATCPDCGLIFK